MFDSLMSYDLIFFKCQVLCNFFQLSSGIPFLFVYYSLPSVVMGMGWGKFISAIHHWLVFGGSMFSVPSECHDPSWHFLASPTQVSTSPPESSATKVEIWFKFSFTPNLLLLGSSPQHPFLLLMSFTSDLENPRNIPAFPQWSFPCWSLIGGLLCQADSFCILPSWFFNKFDSPRRLLNVYC